MFDFLLIDVVIGFILLYFIYIINDFISCILLIVSFFMVKDIERLLYGGDRRIVFDYELYGVVVDGINVFMVESSLGGKM